MSSLPETSLRLGTRTRSGRLASTDASPHARVQGVSTCPPGWVLTAVWCTAVVLFAAAGLPATPSTAGTHAPEPSVARATPPRSAEHVLEEIQDLEKQLHHLLTVSRAASVRHAFEASTLRRRVQLLVDGVHALEREAASISGPLEETVETKLSALQLRAHDLKVILDDGFVLKSGAARPGADVLVLDRVPGAGRAVHATLNDSCIDAPVVGLGSYAGFTTEATVDGEAACGSSLRTPDVWFRFVPSEDGRIVAETFNADFDTVLSLHSGCPGTVNNQISCNDDTLGLQSALVFDVEAGEEFLIRVSGAAGAMGQYELRLAPSGEIRGEVRRAADGEPVSASVYVFDEHGLAAGTDSTDSAGRWAVGGLVSGQYYAGVDHWTGPLIDELWNDIPCAGGGMSLGCEPTDGDPIPLMAGQVVGGIDFDLDEWGEISGIVRDSESLEPVFYAMVELWPEDGSAVVRSDRTDADGAYSLQYLSPGSYFVTAVSSRHYGELFDNMPCPGGAPAGCDPTTGTPVAAALNTITTGIDFSLLPKAKITGIVRDAQTGGSLSSARVTVWDSQGIEVGRDYTDSDGAYAVGGLEPGSYFVSARGTQHLGQVFHHEDCPFTGCDPLVGLPVEVGYRQVVAGIDFDLSPLGRISGVVTDSVTGMPLPVEHVEIFDSSGSVVDIASTDAVGRYLTDGLADGAYYAFIDDPDYVDEVYLDTVCTGECDPTTGSPVPVLLGQVTDGIDFSLTPRGRITGTVTQVATGEPVPWIQVAVYREDGSFVGSANSQSTGEYLYSGLDEGVYFVIARDADVLDEIYDDVPWCGETWTGDCELTTGTPIEIVPPATVAGVDFELHMKGMIDVTIASSDGGVAGGRILAVDSDGQIAAARDFWVGTVPKTYRLSGLPPGEYWVVADSTPGYGDAVFDGLVCPGEYPEACDATSIGDPVAVDLDTIVGGIELVVNRHGTIRGRLTRARDDEPIYRWGRVLLLDDTGTEVDSASPMPNGSYVLSDIYEGTYYVITSSGLVDELYENIPCPHGIGVGCDLGSGAPFDMTGGPTFTGIDFALDSWGSISGVITDEVTGDPISSRVEAWSDTGEQVGTDTADAAGAYEIYGLDTGIYFVTTNVGGSYIDELYDDLPCYSGAPRGCDPTKGTPIEVEITSSTRFIDFSLGSLSYPGGVSGTVTREASGRAIMGVAVDIWDASGELVGTRVTDEQGRYHLNLDSGSYFISTDNPLGYDNEIFHDLACPGGSAFGGECDPTTGDPVWVGDEGITDGVDFALTSPPFVDGFESGGLLGWSRCFP